MFVEIQLSICNKTKQISQLNYIRINKFKLIRKVTSYVNEEKIRSHVCLLPYSSYKM